MRLQLLVVQLRPAVHPGFQDLPEPIRPMPRTIDLLTTAGNGPAAIDGFDPAHDATLVFRHGQITPPQFLQGPQPVVPVVDRFELVHIQKVG